MSFCIPPLLTAKYSHPETNKMYLSILVLCVNLLAAFPQAWAQPLRHHLTLRVSHRHHMALHHQRSAHKLAPPGVPGQHIFSSGLGSTPSPMDLDPRNPNDPNFLDLKISHDVSGS